MQMAALFARLPFIKIALSLCRLGNYVACLLSPLPDNLFLFMEFNYMNILPLNIARLAGAIACFVILYEETLLKYGRVSLRILTLPLKENAQY